MSEVKRSILLCRTTSPRFIDDAEVVNDHQGGTRTRSAEAHG
jgi:hypothetical protein